MRPVRTCRAYSVVGYRSPRRAATPSPWRPPRVPTARINDVVDMGDVVNRAAKLASEGRKNYKPPLMVDDDSYSNVDSDDQAFLTKDYGLGCYPGNVINKLRA